ncbi:hypothetical protein PIB30_099528 [Stylosanthes scabra]|uniref:Uncharacterized protein n=1 Tax=Stylosanthes scabra TaxID=79078 RepID=A0ABU6UWJ2_9FABA|nr:hypothetical protein [Stylosanthes scabra]
MIRCPPQRLFVAGQRKSVQPCHGSRSLQNPKIRAWLPRKNEWCGRGGQGRGGGETRQPEDRMCHTPPGLAHREKQVEKMKKMESGNLASGASKAPRICVDITQEPTHMRGIYHQGHFEQPRNPRICVGLRGFEPCLSNSDLTSSC